MKKIFLISLLFLAMILAVSSVAGADNATDAVGDVSGDSSDNIEKVDESSKNQVLGQSIPDESDAVVGDGNDSGGNSTSEVVKSKSAVSASKVNGYQSFKIKIVAKLTIDGKVASGKKVIFNINDMNYTRKTNANGQATLGITLAKGSYDVKLYYDGDANTNSSKGNTKVEIKEAKKTKFLVDNYLNFRQGLKSLFYVRLVDANSKPLSAQVVNIKVAGKTYKTKTTKKGYARVFLSLKKGTYTLKASFAKNQPYLASSKNVKIVVRSKMAKGNGYWMWPKHMSTTSLKELAARGTKHIFLEGDAVSSYGKSYVASWIKKAHSYGIKVHLWILVCYNGDWVSPVRDDGSFKMDFINKKINEAKYYASIPGVDGIHLDYMRYGGTAHKHINAVESINYIVKKISYAVHKIKPNAIVSVAIMPEPKMMHYYYGQDVPVLSRYVDALLPMVYKGSYGKTTSWIKSVTKTFAKQSNGAQIWTGLQTYKSEEDTTMLSYNALMKDARSAMAGEASGVVLFRIGLTHYLNFNEV